METKTELTVIESVERKALAWTFGFQNTAIVQSLFSRTQDFTTINLSELDVVLLFAKIFTGKVDMDWHKYVSFTNIRNTRAQKLEIFYKFSAKEIRNRFFGCELVTWQTYLMFFFKKRNC